MTVGDTLHNIKLHNRNYFLFNSFSKFQILLKGKSHLGNSVSLSSSKHWLLISLVHKDKTSPSLRTSHEQRSLVRNTVFYLLRGRRVFMVLIRNFRVKQPGFMPAATQELCVTDYLISLCLGFLTFKVRTVTVLSS